jgi:four helix bundle protein
VVAVYRLTDGFPADERYRLTSQLRRAVGSVSSNIVEGSKRQSSREFARFLEIAEASAAEVRDLLEQCIDVRLADPSGEALANEMAEIGLMLAALRRRILG